MTGRIRLVLVTGLEWAGTNPAASNLAATTSPNDEPTEHLAPHRPCLACGYDLQGLGAEPRCPECGLLNIPDGYRRQVWELVDSGKVFISSVFGVFRKRLPGWWWSLDRPGDLSRALRLACLHFTCPVVMTLACSIFLGSIVREEITFQSSQWQGRGPRGALTWTSWTRHIYYLGHEEFEGDHMIDERIIGPQPPNGTQSTSSIQLSARALVPGLFVCLLLLMLWLVPAGVGLSTQIRKSLPSFAHPPRTIWTAALLESHRLVYTGGAVSLLLLADGVMRWKGWTPGPWWSYRFWLMVTFTAATISALGWIGPLRSDYTRQLIQSRKHALRILIMYCWAFPLLICGTIWWFYSTRGY